MTIETKILGVAYGGGHANIVIPVLKELNKRRIATQFLALTSAGPQAEREGLPYRSFVDFKHLVDSRKARKLGSKLAADMHNPQLGISYEESVYYLGINLLENIEALGDDLAMEVLELAGRHSFLAVEFLKKVITEEGCTHILTTNSPRSEKASLIAAQQLGLKSFKIEDLYGVPILFDSLMRKMGVDHYYQTTGRFKITPTQSCFLCDYARDYFISVQDKWDMVGVDHANSTVTGQPVFDVIDEIIGTKPDSTVFPNRPDLPTVIWAHENGHRDEKEVIAMLEQCFRSRRQAFNLVLKLRPNLEPRQITDVIGLFDDSRGNFKVIHTEMDPNALIWNSTVVIGQVSTMLTQAAYMGRPVVIMDPLKIRNEEPLALNGVARVVSDAEELFNAIELLSQPGSQIFRGFEQGRQNMHFQNQGTKNICQLIEQYI